MSSEETPKPITPTGPVISEPPAPEAISADLRLAFEVMQANPSASEPPSLDIPMAHIGQVSVGTMGEKDLPCFGYARHQHQLVYINVAGPKALIESMRSHILKGKAISILAGGETIPLYPDLKLEQGAPSAYTTFEYAETSSRVRHVVMIHRRLYESLPGKPQLYLMGEDQQNLMRILADQTGLPLLPSWTSTLWQIAEHANLISLCEGGPTRIYHVNSDKKTWRTTIQAAITETILTF